MPNISVEELQRSPVSQRQVDLVERKGVGHPDSMCAAIAEAVSIALCQADLENEGIDILQDRLDYACCRLCYRSGDRNFCRFCADDLYWI